MRSILTTTRAAYLERLVDRKGELTTKIWPGHGTKAIPMQAPARWFEKGQPYVPFLYRGGDDGQTATFAATHIALCVALVHAEGYDGAIRAALDARRIERFTPEIIGDFAKWESARDEGVRTYYLVTGATKLATPIPFTSIELIEPGTNGRFVAPRFTEGSKSYARVLLPTSAEIAEWVRVQQAAHEALLALPLAERWNALAPREAA